MSPAAGPTSPSDRPHVMVPAVISPASSAVSPPTAEIVAKDAILTWYRGEFAAANAIIDALCNHITHLCGSGASDYEAVFAAIHRRRLNWIPVLQMQKYFSITDVARELRKVAEANRAVLTETVMVDENKIEEVKGNDLETLKKEQINEPLQEEEDANCNGNGGFSDSVDEDSPDSEITDTGSQEVLHVRLEHHEICDNHEECGCRREQIKMTKGFVAKEPMNVVKGLKMFEDIFTDGEMSRLNDFVDELRLQGQNGELLGETYILFNKQVKGSKREQVQLGVPIFGHIKNETPSEEHKPNIEPIPTLLQSVIDHLVQWQIIPETRKPNGCIINYFDEGDYSLPYLKPPHLDQPICTLLLSESTLAFGRTLVNDGEGNFKGHLMISATKGCVLVMRNHSADMARHAMCPSPTKRASITFYRLRPDTNHNHLSNQGKAMAPLTQALTVWQPGVLSPCSLNLIPNGYEATMSMVPKWGLIHGPLMTVPSAVPMQVNPRKLPRGGTGVFLPWGVKSRKPARHLPPRALKGRLPALPSVDTHALETMSDPDSSSSSISQLKSSSSSAALRRCLRSSDLSKLTTFLSSSSSLPRSSISSQPRSSSSGEAFIGALLASSLTSGTTTSSAILDNSGTPSDDSSTLDNSSLIDSTTSTFFFFFSSTKVSDDS
ncbi:hypothetical protein V2J09_009193 [Rumex salicifolius]